MQEFPAQAGMNRPMPVYSVPGLGVPRASGDEPTEKPGPECIQASSPRKRG